MQHSLQDVAQAWITTRDRALLDEARTIIRSVPTDASYSAAMSVLGISYFGSTNGSAKIAKGAKVDVDTYCLYIAPGNESGIEMCPMRSPGCSMGCLNLSGHALLERYSGTARIARARTIRSWVLAISPRLFDRLVEHEIRRDHARVTRRGRTFAVRLNGTSDMPHRGLQRVLDSLGVQRYEYTKVPVYASLLPQVHWTFSLSETNWYAAARWVSQGGRIAVPVVARDVTEALSIKGAYTMDTHDVRFLDPSEAPAGWLGVLKVKRVPEAFALEAQKRGFFLDASRLREFVALVDEQRTADRLRESVAA